MEKRDPFGRSELHYAASDGDADAARRMIRKGADANLPDKQGWTPLHFAAQSQSVEIIEALLAAGADPNRQDAHGNSPLFRATFVCRGDGRVIQLLKQSGADPLLKNKSGVSAVSLARTIANFDVAQFFVDMP